MGRLAVDAGWPDFPMTTAASVFSAESAAEKEHVHASGNAGEDIQLLQLELQGIVGNLRQEDSTVRAMVEQAKSRFTKGGQQVMDLARQADDELRSFHASDDDSGTAAL